MTVLMVANDGGHLMQLKTLAPRLGLGEDRVWVTVPTPQTRSLLEGETVHWVSPAVTRDARAVLRNTRLAVEVFRRHQVTAAVSTGSSLALSVLPQARARGIPTYYVESATRVGGPSVSGRLLSGVPGVRLYTQHRSWAGGRWRYGGSVFDGYRRDTGDGLEPDVIRRVVVSLGTSERYGFLRMVQRLRTQIPNDADVLWQTGTTPVSGMGIIGRPAVPAQELHEAMRKADVVVAHAGTGVALAALEAGKLPVLVPRRPELGEHVDDHQLQIAGDLAARGLAVVREADTVRLADLVEAARCRVLRAENPPPFDW